MKELFLSAMLAALAGDTFAQQSDNIHTPPPPPTAVQQNFEMTDHWINIRDYIYLPNKAKVIAELNHVDQYNELRSVDTLLRHIMQEIAFYKDSLRDNPGSVRIDYTVDEELGIKKMRFKRYPADGTLFMSRNNDIARLKIDQDTVRILVKHCPVSAINSNKKMPRGQYRELFNTYKVYQLTFCVNSYEDIATIAADKQALYHAIDTMMNTKREGTRTDPHKFPSSALYNPYATRDDIKDRYWRAGADVRFKNYGGLLRSETPQNWRLINRADKLVFGANLGASLLRNTWAPYGDVSLALAKQSRRPYRGDYIRSSFTLSASCYLLFDRGADNQYYTKQNWFVNASYLEGEELGAGVGYLFHSKGDFFKGTTAKFFMDIHPWKKGPTLTPELIFTNNFQQVIPALTLKVF